MNSLGKGTSSANILFVIIRAEWGLERSIDLPGVTQQKNSRIQNFFESQAPYLSSEGQGGKITKTTGDKRC